MGPGTMTQATSRSDWRLLHGVAFVLCMACSLLVPAFRRWPWAWLVPFLVYLFLVACLPGLRSTMCWFRLGRISVASVGATVGLMALTTLALVIFQSTVRPDVRSYGAALQLHAFGGVVTAGVVFAVVNATLEELVFRGVLFDAVQSQWGASVTVVATALLFGVGHVRGYPSGALGAFFATLFGLVLGTLRLWTGGLALPIVAHMGADATIYAILVNSGALRDFGSGLAEANALIRDG